MPSATSLWSRIVAAEDRAAPECRQALGELIERYWEPVYLYVRRRGRHDHSAEDLTQEFFAYVLERDLLARFNRDRGKLKTFLLAVLDHFLSDQRDHEHAAKRGGGRVVAIDPAVVAAGAARGPAAFLAALVENRDAFAAVDAAAFRAAIHAARARVPADSPYRALADLALALLEGDLDAPARASLADACLIEDPVKRDYTCAVLSLGLLAGGHETAPRVRALAGTTDPGRRFAELWPTDRDELRALLRLPEADFR